MINHPLKYLFFLLCWIAMSSCNSAFDQPLPSSCWESSENPENCAYFHPTDSVLEFYLFRDLGNCDYANLRWTNAQIESKENNELIVSRNSFKSRIEYFIDSIVITSDFENEAETLVFYRKDDCEFIKKEIFKEQVNMSDHLWETIKHQEQLIEKLKSTTTLDSIQRMAYDAIDGSRYLTTNYLFEIEDLNYSCENRSIDLGIRCISKFEHGLFLIEIESLISLIEPEDYNQFPSKIVDEKIRRSSNFAFGELLVFYNQLVIYLYQQEDKR